jgi:ATP-binding cassette subfamily F protein 3
MEGLRQKIDGLDSKLADPGLYDDAPQEAVALGQAREKLKGELDAAEEIWLEASESYEAAAGESHNSAT